MGREPRRSLAAAGLSLLGAALALVIAEAAVGAAGLDVAALHRVLYWQRSDLLVHQEVDDERLFALRPGARAQVGGLDGAPVTVTIDPLGARGVGHPEEPAPGGLRILFCGASTVYGQGVGDDETLPARLEAHLGEALGRPVEVFNFGVSAYVPLQIAAQARRQLDAVPGVDALLLLFTNHGRRALLGDGTTTPEALAARLAADPALWLENLPEGPAPPGLHRPLLGASALYRYAAAAWRARRRDPPAAPEVMDREIAALTSLGDEALRRGVRLYVAGWPRGPGVDTLPWYVGAGRIPGARVVSFVGAGEAPVSTELHPPPGALDAMAALGAASLIEAGVGGGPPAEAASPR